MHNVVPGLYQSFHNCEVLIATHCSRWLPWLHSLSHMSVFRSTSNCQHLGFLPEGFICHPIFFSPYTPMQAGSAGESSPSLYHWQMGVDGSEAQLTHCSGRITLRSVSCVVYRRPFSGLSSSYSMCRNLFDNVPFIDSLAVPVSLLRFLANISWGQLHNK